MIPYLLSYYNNKPIQYRLKLNSLRVNHYKVGVKPELPPEFILFVKSGRLEYQGTQCTNTPNLYKIMTAHSSLEGGKIENELTGAGINAKKCRNTSPVTTKNFKIGQRGNPELWPILSFFTYFMGGWVVAPT